MDRANRIYVEDPPIARALYSDVRFAWIWVVLRVYVGYEWIQAGLHKVQDPNWMQTGAALKGFWTGVIAIPAQGRPAITYDWYRSFLQYLLDAQSYTWFAKLVSVGEVLVGIGLVLGAFVGIAAFFGALMNFNFMLAGSASTNPVLFLFAVLLIVAWKTAGYWGLDRYLLPILGTPWRAGSIARQDRGIAPEARPAPSGS